MAVFSIVPQDEVESVLKSAVSARRSTAAAARMAEYDTAILGIQPGEVLRLELESENDSVRGELLRLARASRRTGIDIDAFELDGVIYVSRKSDTPDAPEGDEVATPAPRRGRSKAKATEAVGEPELVPA